MTNARAGDHSMQLSYLDKTLMLVQMPQECPMVLALLLLADLVWVMLLQGLPSHCPQLEVGAEP